MTEGIVIRGHDALMAQQVLVELLTHGPLEAQELKLHGTVGYHVVFRGPKSPTGIGYWPHLTCLFF